MSILIQGGPTGAGRKQPKVTKEWRHECPAVWVVNGRVLTTYSCPDCGARRP